jgi:UDP-N-acetylglucosamine 2-epimerase (non-hydrolysing)
MRLTYIVGARPNFVKLAPVLAELRGRLPDADHVLVHTGQHYDREMSELFIEELGMGEPRHRLGVGAGTQAEQTARVMETLERVLERERPDLAFVPGDVNSTLGAALVLAKLRIPYAHVESGLRSFDRKMPEEINRIVADEFADLLFAHSDDAVENLAAEGIGGSRVHLVGNTMIDTLVRFEDRFRALGTAHTLGLEPGAYLLVTLHRPSLVDGEELGEVLSELDALAGKLDVVFPVHPRTRARLDPRRHPRVHFTEPLGYLPFLSLECDAKAVLTDSGGIQEETTYLGVPCFTLRANTERPVTVRLGTNTVLGLEPRRIGGLPAALEAARAPSEPPPLWDGCASVRIGDVVDAFLRERAPARVDSVAAQPSLALPHGRHYPEAGPVRD